jgi:aldehyde:ferredoxin oxidoreductase
LRVDLTRGEVEVETLDPGLLERGLGGRGLNAVRLLEDTQAGLDPLSPEAPLYFGVGPLTGTSLPASARFTVTAKSPLTGILGASNAGGHWASELKFAGFDQIVVTGRAARPVFLFVQDGGASLHEARGIWGLGIRDATVAVLRRLRAPDAQVLVVGPAGENRVKYACLAANLARVAGRSGMGAVMGSKNLKAIAVQGRGSVSAAEPKRFCELTDLLEDRIARHPEIGKRRRLGTTALMTGLHELGILPVRHFQEGSCDYLGKVSGEHLAENYNRKNKSCFNCSVHCSRYHDTGEVHGEGPEFETLCTFTSRLGVDDARWALRMNRFVNDAGLDAISAGEALGWALECAQRGLLTPADTDGLALRWGDRDTLELLLGKIVRREGFGRLLAEGVRAASQSVGRGSEKLAFHVKGLEMICGDPRGLKAYGLTYAVATRGADHLHAEPFFELSGDREEAQRRFGHPDAADRLAWRGKAALVHWSERMALLTDCLTTCKNVGLCMDVLDFPLAAELLCAGTGMDWSEGKLLGTLDGILKDERRFNRREGVTEQDDTLPERFLTEPLSQGSSAGSVVELDRMLEEYRGLSKDEERGGENGNT